MHKGLLFFGLLFLMRCSSPGGHLDYRSIPETGWEKTPLEFNLPHSIAATPQNIFIYLRNNNDYPFSNIFIIAKMYKDMVLVETDTLEYAMAAADGQWLGSGFTEIKESKLWWKEDYPFESGAKYQVAIEQVVRNNGAVEGVATLQGILNVGVGIEATTQE